MFNWPSRRVILRSSIAALALACGTLGACAMAGWAMRMPELFEFPLGSPPIVFDTGLCLVLGALSLGATGWAEALEAAARRSELGRLRARREAELAFPGDRSVSAAADEEAASGSFGGGGGASKFLRAVAKALALAMAALATAVLAEIVFDQGLGVDAEALHLWRDDGGSRPGRMAPNTAFGMLMAALGLLLSESISEAPSGKARERALVAAAFLALLAGASGLAGTLLMPDLLFGWARSSRMAAGTACGILGLSFALIARMRLATGIARSAGRSEEMIAVFGTAILIVSTLGAGVGGFSMMQGSFAKSRQAVVEADLSGRLRALESERAAFEREARMALDLGGGAREATPEGFARLDARLRALGFEPSQLLGPGGEVLAGPRGPSGLAAELAPKTGLAWEGRLLWRGEFAAGEGMAARLSRPAPMAGAALAEQASAGAGAASALCSFDASALAYDCMPGLGRPSPFKLHAAAPGAKAAIPMDLAMRLPPGARAGSELRGADGGSSYAAYARLGPATGLWVGQDSAAMLSPARAALGGAALFMLAVAALGALLLLSQTIPLARRLVRAEREAARREARSKAILVAVSDAIVAVDERGLVESANPSACALFGRDEAELRGSPLLGLVEAGWRGPARELMLGAAQGAAARQIETMGARPDGSCFPMELAASPAANPGGRSTVAVMRDITVRKEAERALLKMARQDSLTGLPNRTRFMEALRQAAKRQEAEGDPFALMFLDLDGFKAVNDAHSHKVGDELLRQVASRLMEVGRSAAEAVACRLGGDEFTIILESLSAPQAQASSFASAVVAALAEPYDLAGREGERIEARIGASLGCLLVWPGAGSSEDEVSALLAMADDLMYEAKRSGKGRVAMGEAGSHEVWQSVQKDGQGPRPGGATSGG